MNSEPASLRAFENAVIRLVGDNRDDVLRLDELADFHQAIAQGAQFVGVPLELVPQDACRLLKNRLGDGNFDLAVDGEMNQLQCLTPEVEGAGSSFVSRVTRVTDCAADCGPRGLGARSRMA
jgi:hypothetical protein